ncbi:unnamed protein product [Ixodes persulcatus]
MDKIIFPLGGLDYWFHFAQRTYAMRLQHGKNQSTSPEGGVFSKLSNGHPSLCSVQGRSIIISGSSLRQALLELSMVLQARLIHWGIPETRRWLRQCAWKLLTKHHKIGRYNKYRRLSIKHCSVDETISR